MRAKRISTQKKLKEAVRVLTLCVSASVVITGSIVHMLDRAEVLAQEPDPVSSESVILMSNEAPILEATKYVATLCNEATPKCITTMLSDMEPNEREVVAMPVLVIEEPQSNLVRMEADYFPMYDSRTVNDENARTVDIGAIRDNYGIGRSSWYSFEGFEGKIPNINALTTQSGYMSREEIDVEEQTYRGRVMIGVGPAVMTNYYGQYVTAKDMSYGTYIDLKLRNKEDGSTYYLPCVLAECKAHTYPNGYYQTSIAITSSGALDDARSYCSPDYSSVEFTTVRDKGGYNRGSVLSNYVLEEIIVYSLEASIGDEVN